MSRERRRAWRVCRAGRRHGARPGHAFLDVPAWRRVDCADITGHWATLMDRLFVTAGALLAFLAVAAGAFGAHVAAGRLPEARLETLDLAARYQMYHALALVAVGWAASRWPGSASTRSEEHTSELQSRPHLVCRLLLEKK